MTPIPSRVSQTLFCYHSPCCVTKHGLQQSYEVGGAITLPFTEEETEATDIAEPVDEGARVGACVV